MVVSAVDSDRDSSGWLWAGEVSEVSEVSDGVWDPLESELSVCNLSGSWKYSVANLVFRGAALPFELFL